MIQLKFSRLTISQFNDSSKLTTAGEKKITNVILSKWEKMRKCK